MVTMPRNLWHSIFRRGSRRAQQETKPQPLAPPRPATPAIDIAPNDPLLVYLQGISGVVDVEKLELDSPALRAMKAAGVKISVPLVSQGELIGLLNLGQRLSEQDYSTDDNRLLIDLASQAAPALRVAQLARQQQAEAAERERIEHELRVARLIQQTLLPKEIPALPGWHMERYYQPAREVGGDFYDFLNFPDGRVGVVIGDVTDKGVPAALVMATTRSMLRAAAEQLVSPGQVLQRTNELLCPDIPSKMFVTCLYALFDPATGYMQYANAGHDLPYWRNRSGVAELRATGMPLGLLPGMDYEEMEVTLEPGESVLFYSDGLVEAHNAHREMFGFPRLAELIGEHQPGTPLIDYLLGQLNSFVAPGWEQEDDVTLVTLQRLASTTNTQSPATALTGTSTVPGNPPPNIAQNGAQNGVQPGQANAESSALDQNPIDQNPIDEPNLLDPDNLAQAVPAGTADTRVIAEFSIPSEPGNERKAMELVEQAVQELQMPHPQIERLKTAVAEATMNAMEHGNHYQPDKPVIIRLHAGTHALTVEIIDQGSGGQPIASLNTPDIEAKLAGLQTPRGWGLFLIQNMVDEMRVTGNDRHHIIELTMYLEGADDGNENI